MERPKIEEYNNIIDLIKQFESCHPIIQAYHSGNKITRTNNNFQMYTLNGKIIILPNTGISFRYFRGEPAKYPTCKSSINRLSKFDRLIAEIKKIEFIDIIKTFPATIFAEADDHLVDYEALSQHYELKSNVIDLTSDIIVAAFFATNRYDEKKDEYVPVEAGTGVIWFYDHSTSMDIQNSKFRFTGLQPFKRTEEQCAFSFYLSEGEDFSSFAHKVHFKQDPKIGKYIKDLFLDNYNNKLFPSERISEIANVLRTSNSIYVGALNKFRITKGVDVSNEFIVENGIAIRDELIYILAEDELSLMRAEVEEKPFGDKFVTSRLSYRP